MRVQLEMINEELVKQKTDLNWISDVNQEIIALFLSLSQFISNYSDCLLLLSRIKAFFELSHHKYQNLN